MTNKYILGIDTSNYKTSIAVIDDTASVICDIRRFLNVKQGEKGLRQSDALFQHVKNLPAMMEEMAAGFSGRFDAIAYSSRPRPVEGSYMPVFLAGESYARGLGAALHVPVLDFSHQEGHIEAIRAYSGMKCEKRFLACHFSGGTSELLLVEERGAGYHIEIIGGSMDIAFGQVIDRAGVMLGMDFPAGETMDDIALKTTCAGRRLSSIKVTDAWLNLSGIDTQMKRSLSDPEITTSQARDMLIRELFEKITDAMGKMIIQGADRTGIRKIIMAGGVSSSMLIRDRLSRILEAADVYVEFDRKGLSQDNAVGTALLGGKSIWR